jgi:2-phospho-L-lactate guanylyltransferase
VHADRPGHRPAPLPRRRTAVVVPVRALEGAKSRLGAVLDAEERRELVELLMRRAVAAALDAPGVDLVAVVSPDADTLAVAAEAGAQPIPQRTSGLNAGLAEARRVLAGRADRLLVLPGDLPGLIAGDIEAVLSAGDAAARTAGPAVVLAPDRHGRGTNALLLDPPDVIEPAFGGDSRDAHAGLAAAAGAAFVELPGLLGLDVDTPDDLLLVEAAQPEAVHAH